MTAVRRNIPDNLFKFVTNLPFTMQMQFKNITHLSNMIVFFHILLITLVSCDQKMIKKLQIGIKRRPELCNQKSKRGDLLHVYYKGYLDNGKEFDSNILGKKPFTFTLGSGEVIRGWNQGLIGMCIGEKRKLVIPPELAFGRHKVNTIPPNSTLTFHIELVGIEYKEDL